MCIPQSNSSSARPFRATSKFHHRVQHDYHDHAHDDLDENSMQRILSLKKPVARGGVTCPFPEKLHELLDTLEQDGHSHIISWQPHGRCFVVHKPKEFVASIMPAYFNQSRYASFQRQLNLYGFVRLTKQGPDKGGYYHEFFLQGKPHLARNIHRCKVKGTGVRARSNPESEPDFYAMPPVHQENSSSASRIVPTAPTQQQPQQVCSASTAEFDSFQQEATLPDTSSSLSSSSCWNTTPLAEPQDNDDIIMFEGKPFHYLDPMDTTTPKVCLRIVTPTTLEKDQDDDDEPFTKSEMEHFLQDMHLPSDLYHDIVETVEGEEDEFGQLLERIIE